MARCSLALLAVLPLVGALSSLPSRGVPCGTVETYNPAYATCDPTVVPTNYYNAMKAGTLNMQQLGLETNGACDFIEDAFEETFTSSVLNTTRWIPSELDGQEHCLGLPPSGPTTCTMMSRNNVMLGQTYPASLGGGVGAVLKLTQSQCVANPASCCNSKGTICTNWTGAHLVSAGCIQYGVLELEAAFNAPPAGGGFYFTATYVVNGQGDGSWNEIDIGMINNINNQLEFHATIFTANYSRPTVTLMDALNFAGAGIGTSINVNTPIKLINGIPAPMNYFNTSFAASFHNYKVLWTASTITWMVDTTVYRNISYAPWRPMGIRQILRTNKGVNLPLGSPDTLIYVRRIRYTPYSPQAIADAMRCVSLFSCYGALPSAASGTASLYVSVNTPSTGVGSGGRHLLQQSLANGAALASAVAANIPGVPPENVTAAASAFGITFSIVLYGLNSTAGGDALYTYQSMALQPSLIGGVASDVTPDAENVIIQSVTDDVTGNIVTVQVLVTGYASAAEVQTDFADLQAQGAATLDATAQAINNAMGVISTPYISTGVSSSSTNPDATPIPVDNTDLAGSMLANLQLCPSYPDFWDATCLDPATRNPPSVWCAQCVLVDLLNLNVVTTYSISVPSAASAVDATEAALNAALNSGLIGAALAPPSGRRRSLLHAGGRQLLQASNISIGASDNLVMQRIIAASSGNQLCAEAEVRSIEWQATGIAFVCAFGLQSFALVTLLLYANTLRSQLKMLRLSKMSTGDQA